jgi:hypothetical protein
LVWNKKDTLIDWDGKIKQIKEKHEENQYNEIERYDLGSTILSVSHQK